MNLLLLQARSGGKSANPERASNNTYKFVATLTAYGFSSHCSRIDLNKILFPGTFFTFPH